jgi:hypothetical protein
MLVDRLSTNVERKSKFVELIAEPLLKFQDFIPIIISKVSNNVNVLPFYKGLDGVGVGAGSSTLKSSILTKKFLELFHELFER